MGILIGMDEAGYGPNLGPLVVAATAWEVADEGSGFRVQDFSGGPASAGRRTSRLQNSGVSVAPASKAEVGELDLYSLLDDFVSRSPKADRLAIADSKALYRPGLGLSLLERGMHAALAALDKPAASWSAIVEALSADPDGSQRDLPWHAGFDCDLPVDVAGDELMLLGARLSATCAAAGARPVALRARLVFPAEFNELTERHGSKGAALSHVTIGLLREMLQTLAGCAAAAEPPAKPGADRSYFGTPVPVLAVCDKHGGRNHYHGLLQHFFPDQWIETLVESRAESRYHWGVPDTRVEVAFRRGGESFLPAALASMTAKYLRELAMKAWNAFWCARVPGLRPTAGYPLDARRFKTGIESTQRALGIDDHILWRNR